MTDDSTTKNTAEIIARLRTVGAELTECPPDLKETICRFVGALREEGVQAEQAVSMIERAMARSRIVEDYGLNPRMREAVVKDCITAYYSSIS